jgi:hypothetical protein
MPTYRTCMRVVMSFWGFGPLRIGWSRYVRKLCWSVLEF